MSYRPQLTDPIPMLLLTPTTTTVSGVTKKTFPSIEQGILFYGSFKTYGGTETDVNGVYSIVDTAVVETWFNPDIQSNCRIVVTVNNAIYEVINEPENINMRNQFLKFKVKRVKGGV